MEKRRFVTQLGVILGAFVVSLFLFRCGPGLSTLDRSNNGNKTSTPNTVLPSAISGLRTWLKSDAGITIATGVSNWMDQSGIGNDFDQATAGSQPGFVGSDSLFNGRSSLTFSGSQSLGRSVGDSTFGTSEATWAVVSPSTPASLRELFLRLENREPAPSTTAGELLPRNKGAPPISTLNSSR